MNVLLSINPEYVAKIFSGEKKFEYRRRVPGIRVGYVILVYCTAPTSKVVGELHIREILEESPAKIWKKTNSWAGIDRARYFAYFNKAKTAYAMKIAKYIEYKTQISPREVIPSFAAPQSFRYVSPELTEIFRDQGKSNGQLLAI